MMDNDEFLQKMEKLDATRLKGNQAQYLLEGMQEYLRVLQKDLWMECTQFARKHPSDDRGIAARVQRIAGLGDLWELMKRDAASGREAADKMQRLSEHKSELDNG